MSTNPNNLLTKFNLEIRLNRSKKLLKDWRAEYNEGRKKKDQIRSFHYSLALRYLELYWGNFNANIKTTMYSLKKGELPTLRVSNGALSEEFEVTKKTIWNARKRMEKAGLIAYKCWHGTNAPYEIWINPLVLYFSDITNPTPGHPFKANLNHLFFASNWKNLHHTVSGLYPAQDTNKEKNRKGEEIEENVDNFSQSTAKSISSKGSIQVTNETSYQPSKQNPSNQEKQVTAPPVPATPPAVMPETIEEALAHLTEKDAIDVKLIATICFSYAQETIFDKKFDFLSDAQKQAGIRGLAEYISWGAKPKQYKAVKGILLQRLYLASKWFNKKPRRWVNLPDYYFDMRNTTGSFMHTIQMQKDHERTKYKDRRRKSMRAAVSKYSNALMSDMSPEGKTKLHHELTQSLRKKYGSQTVQIFEKHINNIILNS